MGGWFCIDTLSWTKKKFSFFLLFLYRNDIRTFFFVWDESNVLMFLLQAWRAKKNFLYYFYGRKHVFVCSLASRNVILIYNKNNFSLFRFITFFNATIKNILWFCVCVFEIYFSIKFPFSERKKWNNLIQFEITSCVYPHPIFWFIRHVLCYSLNRILNHKSNNSIKLSLTTIVYQYNKSYIKTNGVVQLFWVDLLSHTTLPNTEVQFIY